MLEKRSWERYRDDVDIGAAEGCRHSQGEVGEVAERGLPAGHVFRPGRKGEVPGEVLDGCSGLRTSRQARLRTPMTTHAPATTSTMRLSRKGSSGSKASGPKRPRTGMTWGRRRPTSDYDQLDGLDSSTDLAPDRRHVYAAPSRLHLNRWALSGDWTRAIGCGPCERPGSFSTVQRSLVDWQS
jgi:hypothetical protein